MKNIPKAYELIRTEELDALKSKGYVLRHIKSGAHLALIENDDDNKVFYIGFRTPPEDSTGVPHIIEHTVLCGSEKYPAKDPFIELVKGSLNTFLNAMTYPDKTVYPVASTNDKDFANLMDVYLDAVFHPNIYHRKEIFKQEGWHYELEEPDGELTINGVVYNEMKGAFSNPDDVLTREIMNSLFPDTPYGVESGGDPKNIPDLTYEDFLHFHGRYYHPSNSYIYLYGDMDMEERLSYLDSEYLSKYDAIDPASAIPMQKAFDTPKSAVKEYPIASEEPEEDQTYLSYNVVIGDALDAELYQAFGVIDYAILSAPGAPLKKALLDKGIAKDIIGGHDTGTLQPVFSVIAKGANPKDEEVFVSTIKEELLKLVRNGIDKKALLAGINSDIFVFREADFGSYPKGLIYGLTAMDSWLYDENAPFLHLYADTVLTALKDKIDTGYFEELIQKYLIDNTHVSVLRVEPKKGLTTEEDAALKKKLSGIKEALSAEEREALVKETAELKKYQSEPSTTEELEKIPILKRSDLGRDPRPFHNEEHTIDGIKVLHHDLYTHGIHYLDLVFDAKDIPAEKISAFSLMSRMLGFLDTSRHSYMDFSNEIKLHTGGIYAVYQIYHTLDGEALPKFEVRAKFLYEEESDAIELIREFMFDTLFTDKKRIREIVRQEISRLSMQMMQAGNAVAALRATAQFSEEAVLNDGYSGVAYYRYLKALDEDFDNRIDEAIADFESIRRLMFRKGTLLISTTGDKTALSQVEKNIRTFTDALYDETVSDEAGSKPALISEKEGFGTAGQVQYVALSGNYKKAGYEYSGMMRMARVILNYDYLWNNVRVLGGAYGCSANFTRNGECTLTSYRDPNLKNTVEIFEKTADYLEKFDADERDLTKYIIGTVSVADTPLTPSQDGFRSLSAYFTGVTEELLKKERIGVIDATVEDIRALAAPVREAMSQGHLCVVGNEDAIKADAELFDKTEQLL